MTIWLSAGEPSGDRWGASLAMALARFEPRARLVGVAGPRMRACGVEGISLPGDGGVMGLLEPVRHARRLLATYRGAVDLLRRERPAVVVVIDSPEAHLRFLRHVNALGAASVYYIPPQVWAWRARRVRDVARRSRYVVTAFPWEPELFSRWMPSENVRWLGHPLIDDLEDRLPDAPARARLALLPGSRRGEIARLAPLMAEAAARVADASDTTESIFAVHSPTAAEWVRCAVGDAVPIAVGRTQSVLNESSVAAVCAGSATLEAACAGLPVVVAYRTDRVTYAVARRLVRTRWIGLPNVVLQEQAYPELVQGVLSAESLAGALSAVQSRPRQHWRERGRMVRARLRNAELEEDGRTVAERVADVVLGAAREDGRCAA